MLIEKSEGKVISVFSSKGGSGKSFYSTYIPLGIMKEEPEKKILIIDLCKNSSVAKEFGMTGKVTNSVFNWYSSKGENFRDCIYSFGNSNIYYMPSNSEVDKIVEWSNDNIRVNREFYLKKLLQPLKAHFDYIFIDNHPSENDDKSIFSIVAADAIILTTTGELSSMSTTLKDIKLINEIKEAISDKLDLYIALNKVEFNKGDKLHIDCFIESLKGEGIVDEKILPIIRYSTAVKRKRLYQIFEEEKAKNNRYIQNILEDVFSSSREVLRRV